MIGLFRLGGMLSLALLLGAPAAPVPAASPACIGAASLLSPAMFRKYPADPNLPGPWRAPDVRSGRAHLYRTMVRQEGIGPPDLSGKFKVVRLGCGAGLICPLFVDLETGKVISMPALQSVEWDYTRARDVERATGIVDSRLVYRRDSRLLIALGARNEEVKLAGAAIYEWRGSGPRLIRFIPDSMLCPGTDKL